MGANFLSHTQRDAPRLLARTAIIGLCGVVMLRLLRNTSRTLLKCQRGEVAVQTSEELTKV